MEWFFFSVAGYFCLGLSAVVDKFIVTRSPLNPASFSFYVILMSAVFVSLLIPFEQHFLFPSSHLVVLLIAGGSLYFGLYFMFTSYMDIEVSKANPIIVCLIPLFTLFIDMLTQASRSPLRPLDMAGAGLIVLGGFFLSQSGLALARISLKGWIFIITSGLMLAVSNVFSKIAYNELPFFAAFVWQRWAAFLTAIVFILISGKWHSLILRQKGHPSNPPIPKVPVKTFLFGQAAAAVGIILQQYAIKRGNVTLVSALNGAQFFFVILLVFAASRLLPHLLKEDMSRGSLIQKVGWSGVLCAGLVLLFL